MRKFKRLNRKGFTLIELLAVIVILAVIMVIASTSVLSSMNESRKKSLINSAEVAANGFTTNFSEQVLLGQTTILGVAGLMEGTAAKPVAKSLGAAKTALDITDADYDFDEDSGSFVVYDGSKFTVCMVAKTGGNFYVAAATSKTTEAIGSASVGDATNGAMWACSNQTHSWDK